jgi:uncharacterized protein
MLGEDFARAMTGWLYPTEPLQKFWRSFGLFIFLFAMFTLLQVLMALLVFGLGFGADLQQLGKEMQSLQAAAVDAQAVTAVSPLTITFLKSMVIGIFPAGIVMAFVTVFFARFGLAKRMGRLPLEWPKFGPVGWLLVIGGFGVIMLVAAAVLFAVSGIDPSAYETSAQGLNDAKSQAGIVEKTLADLAHDPWLFALALPSVVLAAPLAEELIFRGALFAGLVQTRLGKPGAVIITAALWAVAHAGAAPGMFVGTIFIMGLVLGVLLLRFGSLWVTIACHTAWNTLVAFQMLALGSHT